MNTFRAFLPAAALLAAASAAPGATYVLADTGSEGAPARWSDPSVWTVGGTPATQPPGAGDTIEWSRAGNIALDGAFDVGVFSQYYGDIRLYRPSGHAGDSSLTFVSQLGGGGYQRYQVFDGARLVLGPAASYHGANNDSGPTIGTIHSGGRVELLGAVRSRHTIWTIEDGGTLVFDPVRYEAGWATSHYDEFRVQGGTLSFPSGLDVSGGTQSRQKIVQTGGTVSFGGTFATVPSWDYSWGAGTLAVSNDCAFGEAVALAIPDGASPTLHVAAGATFRTSGATCGSSVTLVKDGGGAAAPDFLPATLDVLGGSFAASVADGSAIDYLTVASGASFATPCERLTVSYLSLHGSLAITRPGLSVPSGGGGNGTVTVDLAAFHEGDVVVSTPNDALRAKARAAAEAAAAATDFEIEESGDVVRIAVGDTWVFDSAAASDLSDAAGWRGGAVPPAGADVTVVGGAVASLTAACPAWSSIETLAGTTLRLAASPGAAALRFSPNAALAVGGGVALTLAETPGTENVRLEAGARLAIADGATVALGAAFAGTASAADLPVLSVPTNATLRVPGGFAFANVDLRCSGAVETTSAGDLAFGSAAAGATAILALSLDGARVSVSNGSVRFACPASGGTVKAAGTWTVADASFSFGAVDGGFDFGTGNPESEEVAILFDGTTLVYRDGDHRVEGGVRLLFANGGGVYRNNHSSFARLYVAGLASLEFGPGTSFRYGLSQDNGGSVGNGRVDFSPSADGHVALVLDGALLNLYHTEGNGKAVAEIRGASRATQTFNTYNRKQPFRGFRAVRLADGAVLTESIGPRDDDGGPSGCTLEDVVAADQQAPFLGGGSFCFSNAIPARTRTYNMTSGANTATGSLSCAVASNAKIVLAPGATWAGTVVWNGGVELSAPDDATPLAFALGGLRLDEPFVFRLWANGACDAIDLTGEGWTGTNAVSFSAKGGLLPEAGDEWILGTLPAGTAPPASSNARWTISTREIAGRDDAVQLVVTASEATFTFASTVTADLNDPAGWQCGYVPVGEDVVIAGEGVAPAVTASAPLPSFASVALRDGAELSVRASCALPPVTMLPGTSLDVSGGSTEASLAAFSAVAPTNGGAPAAAVRVDGGATLAPAAGVGFGNVRMSLLGASLAGAGALSLGWAGSGETAVFGFAATNATVSTAGDGALSFLSPAAGGAVRALGEVSLSGCTVATRRGWVKFCENNPTNEAAEFVLDRTDLAATGVDGNPPCGVLVDGAALVRMENGSRMYRETPSNAQYGEYRPVVRRRGRLAFSGTNPGSPAEIRFPFCGNGDAQVCCQPDEDGWPALELRGTRAWAWMSERGTDGHGAARNGKAVWKVADASFAFGMVYWWSQRPLFFEGLKAVEIEDGTTLSLVRRRLGGDWRFGDSQVGGNAENGSDTDDASGYQTVRLASVPFAGGGSLVVSNELDRLFHVLLTGGENSATGTLSACDAGPGGTNVCILVNDGANWAGTVVAAGDVRLVRNGAAPTRPFEDSGEPAEVSFGGLECRRDFAVRVWGEGTKNFAKTGAKNDRIHFGAAGFLSRGGRIVVDERPGCEPATGAKWWFGTIPAGAPDPSVKGRWRFVRRPSAEPGVDDLWLVYGKMTLVILR